MLIDFFPLQIKERDLTHRREEIAQEEIEVGFDAFSVHLMPGFRHLVLSVGCCVCACHDAVGNEFRQ